MEGKSGEIINPKTIIAQNRIILGDGRHRDPSPFINGHIRRFFIEYDQNFF